MMKYLILLLISFNAFAEWRIDIVNYEGQSMSKDGFATEIDADAYIVKFKSKWGKDERWERVTCDGVISTREVEDIIEGTVTEYRCPQTYTVTKTDITAQRAQEAALAIIKANRECGQSTIDFITLRNASKGISTEDVKTIIAAYADINAMLMTGSLTTAIEEITAEPVTALNTQEDKDAILAFVNACKAN